MSEEARSHFVINEFVDGVDHFMVEVDQKGRARREIGFDAAGVVQYKADGNYGWGERAIWHSLLAWELEPFIEEAQPISAVEFEVAWSRKPPRTAP